MEKRELFTTKVKNVAGGISEKANHVAQQSAELATKTKNSVVKAVDVNGDGQIDIEDVILLAFKVPGVSVKRDAFLQKELATKYAEETIQKAIALNPLQAGIQSEDLESIATAVIQNERIKVTGISAALGAPGGAAVAATIPADIAQYYGCMLRVAQKLLYLYGFPQIEYKDDEQVLDTATMNQIILCMGVMFGVANAKNGLLIMAKALGKGVEKQLLRRALTKGTVFPIVKSITKWFSVNLTKKVFAGFFQKSIPVVGGVLGGGLTYMTFKPCCEKLKKVLQDTYLSNPNYSDSPEIIDIETEEEMEK